MGFPGRRTISRLSSSDRVCFLACASSAWKYGTRNRLYRRMVAMAAAIELRMDKSGLVEQLLRRSFVIGLRCRREVRIDEDASAVSVAAAWVDRQALEVQEDLHLVLGDLDAQL